MIIINLETGKWKHSEFNTWQEITSPELCVPKTHIHIYSSLKAKHSPCWEPPGLVEDWTVPRSPSHSPEDSWAATAAVSPKSASMLAKPGSGVSTAPPPYLFLSVSWNTAVSSCGHPVLACTLHGGQPRRVGTAGTGQPTGPGFYHQFSHCCLRLCYAA